MRGLSTKILELDVTADKAKGMKPAELKSTRPEYDGFGTKQWAKAAHKENSKHIEEKFWNDKCNQEEARPHSEQRTAQLKELNIN